MSVWIPPELRPLLVDIDTLRPDPDNPNNGDVEATAESIRVNGFLGVITVNKETREIAGGHTRVNAMIMLGERQIPAIEVVRDPVAHKRFLVADNHTARLAVMDNGLLAPILLDLKESDIGLMGTGVTDAVFERILADVVAPETPDVDHAFGQPAPLGIFQVVVEFRDEDGQHDLAAELIERGYDTREVTL